MKPWFKQTLLACSASLTIALSGCSLISRAPVVETVETVRVPPPRPEPLPRPDIEVQVLVPSTAPEILTDDYTLVTMTWDDFLSLAQWFESLRLYIEETDAVLNYWEQQE
jgi:hypothetical protein